MRAPAQVRHERTVYYQTAEELNYSTIVRLSIGPGAGPTADYHTRMEESFCVLEDRFSLTCVAKVYRGGPGTFVMMPVGHPHQFRNTGSGTGRVLCICSAPGHEGYFRELDAATERGEVLSRDALARLLARYDTVQL